MLGKPFACNRLKAVDSPFSPCGLFSLAEFTWVNPFGYQFASIIAPFTGIF